jgi:serine/threonine protein kinase
MQAFPIKGNNGNYIYFPNDNDTIVNIEKFSSTFLGVNVETKQKVLIKLINTDILKYYPQRLKLLLEAHNNLKHENILQTKDIVIIEQYIFIITEFFENYSLKKLINDKSLNKKKYEGFFLKIIIQSLIALEYLHCNGLSHCNMTPDKILIENNSFGSPDFDNPSVKIWDLDLIKINKTDSYCEWPDYKSFNIDYASPEQLLNINSLVGAGTDIYSMGLILYEAVAKRHYMAEHSNTFFKQRMQYSTPISNTDKIDDYLFLIIYKACAKKEFHKSARYYNNAEKHEIISTGIQKRYKSAKEFGLTIIKYMDYNMYDNDEDQN